jgi:hypothetical protein
MEVVGEQQKIAKDEQHHRIASAAHLKQFHAHEHDQHGDAGVASEQGTKFAQDASAADDDKKHQNPASGQALIVAPQPASPKEK